MLRALLPLLLLAAACGTDPVSSLGDAGASPDALTAPDAAAPDALAPDAEPAPDAGDPSAVLFDRAHLMRVEIEIDPADWDALRVQTRTLATTLARPECLDSPFDSPFTYFPATVRIDGTTFERAGVRKKGFLGSLSETKPSLKIKLDELVPGTELAGESVFTLNNGLQDPSIIRPCIGLDVFARAGVAAPRCAYAEVFVNGQPLGPYVHVEAVNKTFLRRHFADDEGQLYEGTLSDFRQGWLGTFEQETNQEVPYDRSDLAGLTAALTAPDGTLLAALEPWLDLDAFLRFWAAEVLIDHWDGYNGDTNNFYAYRDPSSGRFYFVPWGVDGILGARPSAAPFSVMAVSLLARRLYLHPEVRPRYLAEMRRQLTAVWDARGSVAEIDRAAALISPALPALSRAPVRNATEELKRFVEMRAAQITAELDAGGAEWTTPLRDRPCFDEGLVEATLSTTFGSHPAQNIFLTGTGALTATVGALSYAGVQVGSASGFGTGPDDAGQAVLLVAATTAEGVVPLVYVVVDPTLLAPGAVPIDNVRARGALLRIPRPGAALEVVGFFWGGWLEIRQGSTQLGAPIDVTVHGLILSQRL